MGFINFLKEIFGFFKKESQKDEKSKLYLEETKAEQISLDKTIYSLWDFLSFSEHTQAFHLVNVIGFDEWIDMDEIRRRIKEIFNVEYKNERSLYPYIKTLVDIGFLEAINIGGRRKWRKKELLIKLSEEKIEGDKEKQKKKIVIKIQK